MVLMLNTKCCFKCDTQKELNEFYKHPQMPDGHVNKCKECNKRDVQLNYKARASQYKAYDRMRNTHDEQRIMSHKYRGIVSRCNWTKTHRSYTVAGMAHLTFASFKRWWKLHKPEYDALYTNYAHSNFSRKYAPSIDRINNRMGYFPQNMQWLALSENCKKHCK